MSDPRTPEVKDWMKRSETQPPDARQSAREVMARLPAVRQRRRWWPFPVLYRKAQTPTTSVTTEYQPSLTPATDGRSPTVIGRTQSMFSPAKAITAGALVFAVGGAFLIAQPGGQQAEVVPAADTSDLMEPAEFTAAFEGRAAQQGTPATCELVEGVNHCLDARPPLAFIQANDPRIDGALTVSFSQIQYPDHWFVTTSYRIYNAGGIWQGSAINSPSVVLVGEGDYEGLYAWMDTEDWGAVRGVIYPAAPPEATDLDPAS